MSKPERVGDLEQDLERYKGQGYNLLLPSTTVQKMSDFHAPTLEIVELSIGKGDVYPTDTWKVDEAREFAPAKPGLMKLSYAAGISWHPTESKRLDDRKNRDYVAYQAVGAIRKADGQWVPLKAEYELDMEVVEEELRQLYTTKARYLKHKENNRERPATDDEKRDYIEAATKRELLRKRKFKVGLAETGAMLRVIRAILALPATYSKEQIQKPFVVQRIVFQPNLNDPEIRRALTVNAVKAISEAYGSTSPTFSSPPIEIEHHPENGDTHHEDGEVVVHEAETKPEPPPFEMPPETKPEPVIGSMTDFAEVVKAGVEPAEKALRALMKDRGYEERFLKKPKIGEWSVEDREKFCRALLSMPKKPWTLQS